MPVMVEPSDVPAEALSVNEPGAGLVSPSPLVRLTARETPDGMVERRRSSERQIVEEAEAVVGLEFNISDAGARAVEGVGLGRNGGEGAGFSLADGADFVAVDIKGMGAPFGDDGAAGGREKIRAGPTHAGVGLGEAERVDFAGGAGLGMGWGVVAGRGAGGFAFEDVGVGLNADRSGGDIGKGDAVAGKIIGEGGAGDGAAGGVKGLEINQAGSKIVDSDMDDSGSRSLSELSSMAMAAIV